MEVLKSDVTTTLGKGFAPTSSSLNLHLGGTVRIQAHAYETFEALVITSGHSGVTIYVRLHEVRALAEAIRVAADELDAQYREAADARTYPPPTAAELQELAAKSAELDPNNLPW